jgi:dTDP-4-dehydrorhamnose reductase
MSDIVILGDGLLGTELFKQTGWSCVSRKSSGFDITDESTLINC